MKLILGIFLFFSLLFQHPNYLNGKYKMEFEDDYVAQNCTIEFNNNTYKRKLLNGKTIKGTVVYDDLIIKLKDNNSELYMELFKNEIQKDTIFFGTKILDKEVSNDLDMTIYSGKLIKVK